MSWIRGIEDFQIDGVACIRVSFLIGASAGLIVNSIPFIKQRYVNYGSRAAVEEARNCDSSKNSPLNTLDQLLSLKVPHYYFYHYYVVSVFCSLVFAQQILSRGYLLRVVSGTSLMRLNEPKLSVDRVVIAWVMMTIQGWRRLYESLRFMKSTSATMPMTIYLTGIIFYVLVNIAVWIEGTDAIITGDIVARSLAAPVISMHDLLYVSVFVAASGIQYNCHGYLASLPKYSLPIHPMFRHVVCPHYTMECVIYICIALIAAPQGRIFNNTLLTAALFVIINLGLVADSTKKWSIGKFGPEKVAERWRMVPWIW